MTAEGTVSIPTSLLERLAPPDGVLDPDQGYCLFCWEVGEEGRHKPDCPWVAARALLDGEGR